MATPSTDEITTPPLDAGETPEPVQPSEPALQPGKPRRTRWILGGIGCLILLAGLGALVGYQSGITARQSFRSTQVASAAMEQYTLGLMDMSEGRLQVARQRFEAVIQMNPSFPGAVDRLAEVALALSITNTPTPQPSPTVTPTPDLRGVEDLYNQVRQYLADENWQGALDTLETLRKDSIDYRTVEVDGMYYVALRSRGVARIAEGSLEMGLYDLTLASRFGYLDGQALGLQTIARLYITGASFWEIDWKQASYYFEQVYPYYPSLRDASGQTARDRFRQATLEYADDLAQAGDACGAQAQYEKVMQLGLDATVQPTLDSIREACSGASATEPPADNNQPSTTPTTPVVASPSPSATTETPVADTTPEPGTTPSVEPTEPTTGGVPATEVVPAPGG